MTLRHFRVSWPAAHLPHGTVTEVALIAQIERLIRERFLGAPAGPITVEALDEQHRVSWRAFYKTPQQLPSLLDELQSHGESGVRPCAVLPGERTRDTA